MRRIAGSSSTTRTKVIEASRSAGTGRSRSGCRAAGRGGSSRTKVSPPPGVSSVAIVPPIASVRPCATARPRPDAVLLRARRRAAGTGRTAAPGRGRATPGPGVRDPQRRRGRPRRRRRRGPARVAGVYFSAFSQMLASTRSSSPASASTSTSGSTATSIRSPPASGAMLARTAVGEVDLDQHGAHRAGADPAHVEQVGHQGAQPVGGLLDRLEQLGLVLRREGDVGRCAGWRRPP